MCQLKVTLFLLGECPFFQEFFHFPLQGEVCVSSGLRQVLSWTLLGAL